MQFSLHMQLVCFHERQPKAPLLFFDFTKIQEETQILRQALVADRSDYRRAQFCMDKLGDLEILLWESHGAESRASTNLSVERLQVSLQPHL